MLESLCDGFCTVALEQESVMGPEKGKPQADAYMQGVDAPDASLVAAPAAIPITKTPEEEPKTLEEEPARTSKRKRPATEAQVS